MKRIEIEPGIEITNDRCLIFKKEKVLVIGDLHLGYEKTLEEEGIYIPRFNTGLVREAINKLLERYEPNVVVLLGDIKHDFKRLRYEARDEVRGIITLISDVADVVVVKGNHDNFIQNILVDLGLIAVDYVDIAGYRLEHGHEDSKKRPVIIGHEHPSVKISGAVSGGMKVQCFIHSKEEGIIIIPPFSVFSSGTDLTLTDSESFMSPACKSAKMENSEVYGISEYGLMELGKLSSIYDLEL